MYTVKVRNSIMIAHSLPNPFFGPAQHMHGATYVVDVTFKSKNLDEHNVVIDIGKAKSVTAEVLKTLNYKNLDELPEFKGKLTTTEFVAKHIHDRVKDQVNAFFNGKISVCLGETHDAWASYSGE
ncbi:MAG: 6-carboxytetrahydropterin synthase [Winogradskyella sp.]|uniref:6-pyruvoyl trahydropterin synthase family protein n=1 Tax=Winogradskyella sp. TaxID=1883156 RepID=UPI0025D6966F|nr:6-carboxytetrahydropterin synthase [Winogradskyella sp.]NRB61316.1 6-carboxytetrahydropterin synthase [Winogradskyella sp.]